MLWLMRMMNDFLKISISHLKYILYILYIYLVAFLNTCGKHQLTNVQPVEGKKVKTDL